jgi:serine/threonine protein kinase
MNNSGFVFLLMQVLKLISENNCNINYQIDKEIGFGADGQVFSLQDITDKVIKFCVQFDYNNSIKNSYRDVSKILSFIKNTNPLVYAHVYEYGYLGEYERNLADKKDKQKYILYYYIMEKLHKISEDEKKVFHSILSHEDRNINKNFSIFKIKNILKGLSLGLDFDFEKVMFFCENLKSSIILHNDLHPRNIMKDNLGNFKLIDFDRCMIKM